MPTTGDRCAKIKIRHLWRKSNGMTLYTLVNLLRSRASQHPDRTAYTFLEDGEHESHTLTYRQLDEKAKAIAAYLQAQL